MSDLTMIPPTMPMMSAGPEPMPLEPAGDAARVEKWLHAWLKSAVVNAEEQTKDLVNSTVALDMLYRGRKKTVSGPTTSMEALNAKVEIRDIADQADALAGLLFEVMFPQGPPFTASARNGLKQEIADLIKDAMMQELEATGSMTEIEQSILYYCKFRFGGLKLERRALNVPRCRYDEVSEQDTFALMQYMQMNPEAQAVESGTPGMLRFKVELPPETRPQFALVNMNPRNIRVSNSRRATARQYTMHEAHYWNKGEMKAAGFTNLDKLGIPDGRGKVNPSAAGADAGRGATAPSMDFGEHEVWEDWVRPPFLEEAETGKNFNLADLGAYMEAMGAGAAAGVREQDFEDANWWTVFHTEKATHKIAPSYMWDKSKLPYWNESFIPADDEWVGQALAERQSEANDAVNMMFNHWLDNARCRANMSAFLSSDLGVSVEKYKTIYEPRQLVSLPTQEDIRESVFPFAPEDISPTAERIIRFLRDDIMDKGINPALQGDSNTGTATEANINDARGQVKINASFRRYSRGVLQPALVALRDAMVSSFNVKDWIRQVGENGSAMAGVQWTSPLDANNRMRITPVATFDSSERKQKAQALIMLMNVFGAFLQPNQVNEILKLVLEYNRLSTSEVEAVMAASGSLTDLQKELRTLITDPSATATVRAGDNHAAALSLGQQAAAVIPELMTQTNFAAWMQAHQAGLEAMAMQAAMARPAPPAGKDGDGEKDGEKRGAQPPPKGSNFGNAQSDSRRGGQAVSPPDKGAGPVAGMTGRMVPGTPAGV